MPRRTGGRPAPTLRPGEVDDLLGPDDELVTGEAVALELRPTSFVLRVAGALIDYLAYALLLVGLVLLVVQLVDEGALDEVLAPGGVIVALVTSFVVVPAVVETVSGGRSLGRLAVGARIVRRDGGASGFRQALVRSLVGLLEIVFTTGGLAVVVALLDTSSRRLGDLLAGTYSRNERVPARPRRLAAVPPGLEGWASVADVGPLPDRLARRVAAYVQQAPALDPVSRHRLAVALATEVAVVVSPVPDASAEAFLDAVAALRREREAVALAREQVLVDRLAPALTAVPRGFPRR